MNVTNKKGQMSSTELIIIVGLILAISVPFIVGVLGNLNERVGIENRVQKAIELSNAMETVSNLGPGNSISVQSEYDFQIVSNTLITTLPNGEDITVPLLPNVPDSDAGSGVIQVINPGTGLFFGNSPEIEFLNPNPVKVFATQGDVTPSGELILADIIVSVKIIGNYFTENSKVFLDQKEINSNFIHPNEIEFTADVGSLGEHIVYVVTTMGDTDLESNSVVLEVGYTISIGGVETAN